MVRFVFGLVNEKVKVVNMVGEKLVSFGFLEFVERVRGIFDFLDKVGIVDCVVYDVWWDLVVIKVEEQDIVFVL